MASPAHPAAVHFSYGSFHMQKNMQTQLENESPPSSPSSSSLSSLSQELPNPPSFLSPHNYPPDCTSIFTHLHSLNSPTKRPAAELSNKLIEEAAAAPPPKRLCWAVAGGGAVGLDGDDLDRMLDLLLVDSTALISWPSVSDSLPESYCKEEGIVEPEQPAAWAAAVPPAYSRRHGGSSIDSCLLESHCKEEITFGPEQRASAHDLQKPGGGRNPVLGAASSRNVGASLSPLRGAATDSLPVWHCKAETIIRQPARLPVFRKSGQTRAAPPAYARHGGTDTRHPSRATAQVLNGSICAPDVAQQHQKWAGLTLSDVESALGKVTPSAAAITASFLPLSPPYHVSIGDILKQEAITHHSSSSTITTCSNLAMAPAKLEQEHSLEEDDKIWRKMVQKRNNMEPRYTVKIRCEEDAVSDGYRWRKYGQKSIKNSPFPRSYYRCSSGKCSVKKQVERCSEDAGVLLVSYEGIHLHHRPTAPTSLHQLGPSIATASPHTS